MKRYEITRETLNGQDACVRVSTISGQTVALMTTPGALESDQELCLETVPRAQAPVRSAREVALAALADTDLSMLWIIEEIAECLLRGDAKLSSLSEAAKAQLSQRAELRSQLAEGEVAPGGRLE